MSLLCKDFTNIGYLTRNIKAYVYFYFKRECFINLFGGFRKRVETFCFSYFSRVPYIILVKYYIFRIVLLGVGPCHIIHDMNYILVLP